MASTACGQSSGFPTVEGYHLSQKLADSSRTAVYRAMRTASQQPVVIKVLKQARPSFNDLVKFRNQYTVAQNLPITGIVRPLSLELWQNSYALVMEDFGGISLQQFAQQAPLSLPQILSIAIQMADILHDLSQHHLVHKDIKPANIIIHPETHQIKLTDFSIASLLPRETQELQSPQGLEGTLAYLAPEQTGRMNRGIDYRADFYALGVTLYELLTGDHPFTSNDPLVLVHAHIAKQPTLPHQLNAEIPPAVSTIVLKLMAKDAEDRYQSAFGLKRDLEKCLAQWTGHGRIDLFALGQQDVSDRFRIPEKLYGRQTEVNTLISAFTRVVEPVTVGHSRTAEIVLVAGFSGIGKTAVIQEIHKPITQRQGYFIQGKFDQFNRNTPFSAIIDAFENLMEQLLGTADKTLAEWKSKILATLQDEAQVIVDVVPKLEEIIGPQPPVTELSGAAAQSRFNLLLGKFIRVFAQLEHPLVLFLDDLQWADTASLNLITVLMEEAQTNCLLLLGAYRDNETFSGHPLILTLDDIKKQGTPVHTLTLSPLPTEEISRLVADTLRCPAAIARPLSELIYQKTQGNPFFTTQFLKGLQEDGYITYDVAVGHWQCDLASVRQLAATDDVVAFMVARLQKLPPATQTALKLAACMGNRFDLNALAVVCEQPQAEVAASLWTALQEGFVIPESETYKFFQGNTSRQPEAVEATESDTSSNNATYRFFHDRVQQAAYVLIPDEQRAEIHYALGQRLRQHLSELEQQEALFEIVNHINFGQQLPNHAIDWRQIAQINLAAGEKALSATAYDAAVGYLENGISLLNPPAWTTDYDLAFRLYRSLCTAQLNSASYTALSTTISAALQQITNPVDRADIYVVQVVQNTLCGNYEQATQAGLQGLKELEELGIEATADTLGPQIEETFSAIALSLKGKDVSSLLDLPVATDPTVQAKIKLLIALDPPTYITANIELYSLVSLKAVALSIEHGNIAESIKGYVNYGLLLGLMKGEYTKGYEFADLALQLSYQFDSKSQRCKASLLLGGWIQAWAKPIAGAAEINYQGFLSGVESGEAQFSAYNLFGNIFNRFFQGENLADIAKDIQKYDAIAGKIQDELLLGALAGAKIFVQHLCLTPAERENSSEIADAQAIIEKSIESQTLFGVCLYYILRMQLACITADYEQGQNFATETSKILAATAGFTTYSGYYYYGSLILLGAYSNSSKQKQQEALEQVNTQQQQLKIWSDSCPENFWHKYCLVEAERCRCIGQRSAAVDWYDQAIAGAKANGFIQEEALANELAAQFYVSWGKTYFADQYISEAYYGYIRWGAKTKVTQLEDAYPQLLLGAGFGMEERIEEGITRSHSSFNHSFLEATASSQTAGTTSNSVSAKNIWLDLPTVMNAAQTLSQEIALEKLLAKLVQIAAVNAGAQTGHLLLQENGEWTVVARVHQGQTEIINHACEQYQALPKRLIYSVARTRETAVFTNLSKAAQYAGDAYIADYRPKSVLCTPIYRQENLIGVLYLENSLTVGAFTRDRIEVLKILTSQAAISIENARLYQQTENYATTLKSEVARKTQDLNTKAQDLEQALTNLRKTQAQLVHTEKMSSLGQLVAGVAHEINNPINFIRGNINHTNTYVQDLLRLITCYQQQYPQPNPAIDQLSEEIEIGFLSQDIVKILESMAIGSDRIRQIVLSLRNFSRLDESSIKAVNLHSGLDSTLVILHSRLPATQTKKGLFPEIRIDKDYGEIPLVTCEASQINQVFLSVINNAIDALRDTTRETLPPLSPTITIRSRMIDAEQVEIAIANNGAPIPTNIQSRIFDPFFTTKAVGSGAGLGLSISYSIVQRHGGHMSVSSNTDQGTEFHIQLPVSSVLSDSLEPKLSRAGHIKA